MADIATVHKEIARALGPAQAEGRKTGK